VPPVVRPLPADGAQRGKDEVEDRLEPGGTATGRRDGGTGGHGRQRGEFRPTGERRGCDLPRRGLLLLLDETLAADAVAGERQGLEPSLGDRLGAPLALAEAALVELAERDEDLSQQAAVTVAQLEQELARVRGRRLISEILDAVVFLALPVEGTPADLILELAPLVDERLLEVGHPLLLHLHPSEPPVNDSGATSRRKLARDIMGVQGQSARDGVRHALGS
jgi:hypothetical protein